MWPVGIALASANVPPGVTEFRVLGPLEVRSADAPVAIGHRRRLSVLAALLPDAGRVVATGDLIDRVWSATPPKRAKETLYGYISRLRTVLAAVDVGIERHVGGYLLRAEPQTIDLHRFRSLTSQARTAPDERAADLLERALSEWRGEAFTGLETAWTARLRRQLALERFTAHIDLTDILLRRGNGPALLAELTDRAAAHPLDERLAAQLMRALQQAGRHSEALEHYRLIHARLADEVGASPGAALRILHREILAGDTPTPEYVPRRTAPPRDMPVVTGFVGRHAELSTMDTSVAEGLPVQLVTGQGGVGKTWLALHWARRNSGHFPDGQLYLNLHGFDVTRRPIDPAEALRALLLSLGVEDGDVPNDRFERASLYRRIVAQRRVVIILDNARDAAQAAPLLPNGDGTAAIVTSRASLTSLAVSHGARQLGLRAMDTDDAIGILRHHVGDARLAGEPEAVGRLLHYCAGLPLALAILAARAAANPLLPLHGLAKELGDGGVLDAMDTGDLSASLRAVFAGSHKVLDPDVAEVFALLGRAPCGDLTLEAVASLAGLDPDTTKAALAALQRAHLVEQSPHGRYGMHDLTRRYAAERATSSPEVVDNALTRLAAHYIHTARNADRLLSPGRAQWDGVPFVDGVVDRSLTDRDAALDWFESEHGNIQACIAQAVERGADEFVWHLVWPQRTFYWWRLRVDAEVDAWRAALSAAERLGDDRRRAAAHRMLARRLGRIGRLTEAEGGFTEALRLDERAGNLVGRIITHYMYGAAHEDRGDLDGALRELLRTLDLTRELGDPHREWRALNAVGWVRARLGDLDGARTDCEHAWRILRDCGDHAHEANIMDSLGYIAHHSGDHESALDFLGRAVHERDGTAIKYFKADTMILLGRTHLTLGQREHARRLWTDALALLRAQRRDADAEGVVAEMARLDG